MSLQLHMYSYVCMCVCSAPRFHSSMVKYNIEMIQNTDINFKIFAAVWGSTLLRNVSYVPTKLYGVAAQKIVNIMLYLRMLFVGDCIKLRPWRVIR